MGVLFGQPSQSFNPVVLGKGRPRITQIPELVAGFVVHPANSLWIKSSITLFIVHKFIGPQEVVAEEIVNCNIMILFVLKGYRGIISIERVWEENEETYKKCN